MENITKLIRDIFAMKFDVIIPVSGSIVAIVVGFLLFAVRYFTFNHKRKKYERSQNILHVVTPEIKEDFSGEDESEVDPSREERDEEETLECAEELPDKAPDDKEVSAP